MNPKLQTLLIGAGVAVVALFFVRKQAVEALQAVNPLNNENVIAGGVDTITGAADRGSSLGSDLFDLFNRIRGIPEFDPNAPVSTPPIIG